MASFDDSRASGAYPEGPALETFVRRRQRTGKLWHGLFLAATLVGLLALAALLIDVIDDAFGYIAIQNKVPETVLVVNHYKDKMLAAPRTLSSEDDQKLVEGLASRPTAVGFFGYSYYKNNADRLKLVSVDGVQPAGANDGIPIIVSAENDFLTGVTRAQLHQIFTTAESWSDVDPSWPDKPILHYIPGTDSGTLDFFVAAVFGTTLAEQPHEELVAMLANNISSGRLRALEAEKLLTERSSEEMIQLIEAEVIKPQVAETWSLFESLLRRQEIEAAVAEMPGAELSFKSWVNWNFITSPQSTDPLKSGISVAILGSIWVTAIAFLVAVPLGVAAAIYLEEYSTGQSRFDQIVETNINNLAGVPSIIYGMLGLAVFVRFLGALTSGQAFGVGGEATANGRTILSAGLTLALLILPLVIINAREAIRAVPRAQREASYGLGATRWQTVWNHVLPNSISGILTGVILSVSRAFGETAPLIVVGVSTFIVISPNSPFAKYTTLPAQIYQWTSRPQQEFKHLAAAAILVLLVLLLALNAAAIYLRNRYAQRQY